MNHVQSSWLVGSLCLAREFSSVPCDDERVGWGGVGWGDACVYIADSLCTSETNTICKKNKQQSSCEQIQSLGPSCLCLCPDPFTHQLGNAGQVTDTLCFWEMRLETELTCRVVRMDTWESFESNSRDIASAQ